MFSVFSVRNGSRNAVVTSGSSSMSDSWICWKPRIDEPSNARPSAITVSVKAATGVVKCCIMPGRSQNRTSTYLTSLSLRYCRTSSVLVNIRPPCAVWVRERYERGVAARCLVCFRGVTRLCQEVDHARTTAVPVRRSCSPRPSLSMITAGTARTASRSAGSWRRGPTGRSASTRITRMPNRCMPSVWPPRISPTR